jgi:hypothetical protein
MKEKERITTFWKRWNHEPSDKETFFRFRARVNEVARDTWDKNFKYSASLTEAFAFYSGTTYIYHGSDDNYYERSPLAEMLGKAATLYPVVEAIQFLLWTLASHPVHVKQLKECCDRLNKVLDITPNVPVQVIFNGTEAVLYPTGAELLDEAVIESNLIWLGDYPTVLKPFEDALKIYQSKDVSHYRNMLDSLRFAVEQMLRVVLNNQRSLENQKEVLLPWLAAHGAHSHIVNMHYDLLNGFAQYQNEAVKHNEDEYTLPEIEFVLYLTGTFLRFIQRVAQSSSQGAPAA